MYRREVYGLLSLLGPTQGRTKWRNCRLTPKLQTTNAMGCLGCKQAAGYPKMEFLFYAVKNLPSYREPVWGSSTSFFLYMLMITSKIAFFCLNNNGLPDSTFQIQRFVKKFAKENVLQCNHTALYVDCKFSAQLIEFLSKGLI